MGNSSSNCFRSKEHPSVSSRQLKLSHFDLSTINIKIWKQSLGLVRKKQILDFSFPSQIVHKTFRNIDKDIIRTYPESSFFTGKQINLNMFADVLRRLAVYFPKTGYTQGMNFVVGFFLLSGLNVNQTFTLCVKILTNYEMMCLGLYQDQFPLNRLYCALVWEIVKQQNPLIKQKIDKLNMLDDLWLFQWFATFFIYSFPFQIISELWTFIFLNKYFAMVRLASAVILQLWPQIQKCQCQIEFINLIASLKNKDQFKKVMKPQKLLNRAHKIGNQEVVKFLKTSDLDTRNKYCYFFRLPENDRKVNYLQYMSALSEQRRQFLKNPNTQKFDRKESDISIIDSLQQNQAKMLHQSAAFILNKNNSNSFELLNQKLWKSDVQKLTTFSSNKTIGNVESKTFVKQNQIQTAYNNSKAHNQQLTDCLSPKSKQSKKYSKFEDFLNRQAIL